MNHQQYEKAVRYFKDIADNNGYQKRLVLSDSPEYIRETIESDSVAQVLIDLQQVIKNYSDLKQKEAKQKRLEKADRIAASARTFLSELN